MQSIKPLQLDLSIQDAFAKIFPSYLGISAGSKDKTLLQGFTNVFATNAHQQQQQGQQGVHNNFDVAFAVALVFQLIVEQQVDVFEYIESILGTQVNDKQRYALSLLKYMIYSLDKRQPIIYLNIILANKTIPKQQLKGDVDLSKIYTFVHLCELGTLFKSFQNVFKYKFWSSYQDQSLNGIEDCILFFYQPSPQYPILVLLKHDFQTIQQRVFERHTALISSLGIQLILDAVSKKLSPTVENLKIQPYKFGNTEELALVLFSGQPNLDDRVAKFLAIPQLDKTLGFLIQKGITFNSIVESIKAQQDQELQEEAITQQQSIGNSGEIKNFDIFQTQVPTSNAQGNVLRKTISY